MRTTLNLDEDIIAELKEQAKSDGITITAVANLVLRRGLNRLCEKNRQKKTYQEKPIEMGVPVVTMDKALNMVAALEAEEILRKIDLRK